MKLFSKFREHIYYHQGIGETLDFLIPDNKKILFIGQFNKSYLDYLHPHLCTIVNEDENCLSQLSDKTDSYKHVKCIYENFVPEETYDYIVINSALNESSDICQLLFNIAKGCISSTRIIIYQHNYIWQWILNFATFLKLKNRERVQNWLSISDVKSYIHAMGFDTIRTFRKTILPVKLGRIGGIINFLTTIIPLFDFFKLDQYLIARMVDQQRNDKKLTSLTICITVRDEKGNIEPIVKSLPVLNANQEILFVEGHSKDGTREEIEKMIDLYPKKNIRLIVQSGIGQGNAIKTGFKDANGDIIILYEGDGTSDPGNIKYFYEAIKNRRYEFIEGSRFVYPLYYQSMPVLNRVGNMLFAKMFSLLIGQNVTDVLSGIKAITKDDFKTIYSEWDKMGIEDPFGDFELLLGASRFGLRIGEIPMHYKSRSYGVSKSLIFTHGYQLTKLLMKAYFIFRNPKPLK